MKTIYMLLALVAFAGNAVAAETQASSGLMKVAAAKYPNKGKVDEVNNNSMYTYMHVVTDKGPVWIAASKATVKKGDNISFPDGAVMTNFHSKSMNKTFDTIIFLDKVEVMK